MTSKNTKRDYVGVIYNESDRPFTSYPILLTRYLWKKYNLNKGQRLLDVGCGRGEFIKGFKESGADAYATDQSETIKNYYPEIQFKNADIEKEGIPYPDNFFDVVYSKSVIEHFHDPEKLMKEIFRVLKPGGIVITLCPSWEFNYKTYFEDYSHRTPFMLESLRDIQLIFGFEDVNVSFFRQLPSTWGSLRYIFNFLSKLTQIFAPKILKSKMKWVRISKEIMLLSSAKKPTLKQ